MCIGVESAPRIFLEFFKLIYVKLRGGRARDREAVGQRRLRPRYLRSQRRRRSAIKQDGCDAANMAHPAPVAEGGRMVQPGGGGWSDRVVGREGAIWVVGWSDRT